MYHRLPLVRSFASLVHNCSADCRAALKLQTCRKSLAYSPEGFGRFRSQMLLSVKAGSALCTALCSCPYGMPHALPQCC